MIAPVKNSWSVERPGAPSELRPTACIGGDAGYPRSACAVMFSDVPRAKRWFENRCTGGAEKPSVFSRTRPLARRSVVFSSWERFGFVSATKSGSDSGSVAMNAGVIVMFASRWWQVPQFRPFPSNVSLKKMSEPRWTIGSFDSTSFASVPVTGSIGIPAAPRKKRFSKYVFSPVRTRDRVGSSPPRVTTIMSKS